MIELLRAMRIYVGKISIWHIAIVVSGITATMELMGIPQGYFILKRAIIC